MKTTTLKTKAVSILLVLAMFFSMLPMSVFAADSKPSYVALGDSISTGYGLADKTTQGFTYMLANSLGYTLTNLAVDGNTAAGILAQLQTDAVKTAVTGADLITITAGGNDLMAVLYQAIADQYNATQSNQANYISASDVTKIMADSSDGRRLTILNYALGLLNPGSDIYLIDDQAFTDAVTAFVVTLNQVMSTVKSLNANAKVIVTTQYNPYVEYNGASVTFIMPISLTPIYQGMENGVTALNTAIKNNAATGGYIVADVKAAFDTANSATNDLYVADPATLEFDFHPNAAGHMVLAGTFESAVPVALDKPALPVLSYNSFWLEHKATWTVDENASGYEYELYEDAGTEPVEKDSITVYDGDDECSMYFEYVFKSGSTYKFRIKALGTAGYTDSEWSDYATYTYYHYDPIVVGDELLHYGDKHELDSDSYAVYEGEKGNAVLRLVNFDLTADAIDDVEFLPEKGYENKDSYSGDRRAMIYTHLDNLTIVLEGTNALTCGVDNFAMIKSSGELTVSSTSNGKLTLTSDEINVRGIDAENSVTIQNCELNIAATATAISADDIDFTNCEATLFTTSETGTVIPYYYSNSTNVALTGCIAVAGADKDNTELFERVKYNYKYMKVSVPDVVLEAPKDPKMNDMTASWTAVENATGYEVELYVKYVGGDEFVREEYSSELITETSYTFYYNVAAGEQYYLRVRAFGNGETIGNSEWATSQVYERGDFFIGEVDLKDKQYLYNDGTISTAAPTDPNMGYAYYEKGETDTLTLSNFSFSGLSEDNYNSVIYGARSLDVKLIGDNSLSATEYSYSTGFFFETWPDFSSGQPSFPDVTLKITGEANSTLTVDAEVMASGYTPPYITVGAGVTVTSTGYVYANELTVNGALYVENGGIALLGKLIRGEQGYISAAVEEDAGYGAIEFSTGSDEPVSLTETDFITLNGGEAVDGDGKATAPGQYPYSYDYGPDYSYTEYIITFFDPSIPTADHTGENALKKVIICAKGASTPTFTVNATCDDLWGTIAGSGNYEKGATVTLTATPTDSTKFEYWLDTSVELGDSPTEAELRAAIVSYDAAYTFTATKNVSLEAVFSVSSAIGITPMLIAGTDEKSLLEAEWMDVEYDFGTINPGAEQIALPGEVIDEIVTIGDKQYRFAGFIFYGYDEATETETAELKETLTIGTMPLYNSAEYWDWFAPISDGLFAAYMPYTPQSPDPENPGSQKPTDPQKPDDPKTPTDPETPDNPQNPTDPETPDNPQNPTDPETPDDPQNPTDPETPDNPQNPTDPETPDDPQNPTDPETPDDPQNSGSPHTGDNSNMALWFALLLLSGGAVITFTVYDRKRRTVNSK